MDGRAGPASSTGGASAGGHQVPRDTRRSAHRLARQREGRGAAEQVRASCGGGVVLDARRVLLSVVRFELDRLRSPCGCARGNVRSHWAGRGAQARARGLGGLRCPRLVGGGTVLLAVPLRCCRRRHAPRMRRAYSPWPCGGDARRSAAEVLSIPLWPRSRRRRSATQRAPCGQASGAGVARFDSAILL